MLKPYDVFVLSQLPFFLSVFYIFRLGIFQNYFHTKYQVSSLKIDLVLYGNFSDFFHFPDASLHFPGRSFYFPDTIPYIKAAVSHCLSPRSKVNCLPRQSQNKHLEQKDIRLHGQDCTTRNAQKQIIPVVHDRNTTTSRYIQLHETLYLSLPILIHLTVAAGGWIMPQWRPPYLPEGKRRKKRRVKIIKIKK